ncbi:16S rRNA (cytidine(1402)-2'-O)-methyltransferase [Wenxinia marina]|uniref:Ribosomal RNA small subunit methyltransferase I n=1 Tax=Wenxinia marina DSM 24838 TaxID=1123501 RepID=A0A0D0QHX7_9RHOB|nr:16S rRNA (cytidine(1402)-2'-O)-methyltransferase [Wenxinia marina]KIQ70648.1 putative S-adenosylmethionine-dependent methyltransferase, YraL family [Wenxinia marina DSM 24838]GGL51507.1 ribosomal RNA small subunit methyltransferase I [Wenxinia marina]
MNDAARPVSAGLHFVAVPIGNARDITLRALDVLAGADVLAAEDTRTLRRLMEIHGIALNGRRIVAYHDHSGEADRARLLDELRGGRSVAYASEAGTPLLADPGYALGRAAIAEGLPVVAVPGASALLAALAVAGLPTDTFTFAGFLPSASAQRRARLAELSAAPGTLVLYESPRRLAAALADLASVLGGARPAAVARELTKRFEEVRRGTLDELAAALDAEAVKGEVVVLVGPPAAGAAAADDAAVEAALAEALKTMRVKDAATAVAGALGRPRRDVYQIALALAAEGGT